MIPKEIKASPIFGEFSPEEQNRYFNLSKEKVCAHVDTLYYTVSIHDDSNECPPGVEELLNTLQSEKIKKSLYPSQAIEFFGLSLEMQSGRMEGDVKTDKWRILTKKDRSRRYRTACLEAVFDSYEPNFMHVDDFIMYAGEVGTQAENELQNSYFQNDIKKMKELNQ